LTIESKPAPASISKSTIRERLSSPWTIFLVALVVRLIYITAARSYRFHPGLDHFEFGWEAGRVGRALALGRGFADPFVPSGTGPTAWLPPLYPMIIGAVFRVFGVYSRLSGWVLLAVNGLFNAATIPAIYEIAARCFGEAAGARRGRKIALWSAWIWAVYPATMQYSVRWIWEMSLTTMLFTWAFVVTLRLRGIGNGDAAPSRSRAGLWAAFGLLWGMIALSNATPLLMLPVCGLWIWAGVGDKRRAIAGAALAAVVFAVCLAPWALRNWEVFHSFIPTRGNFGAELYVGNGPQANGFPWGITVFSRPDLDLYARMGEANFVRERGELAKEYIRAHPGHFLDLSLKRAYFYWVNVPHPADKHWLLESLREAVFTVLSVTGWMGLLFSLRRKISGCWLFAWAFVLLPVTYYFVTAGARFRHPLEPLMVILTVNLFASAKPSFAVLRRG
jgi:hypothetical protein